MRLLSIAIRSAVIWGISIGCDEEANPVRRSLDVVNAFKGVVVLSGVVGFKILPVSKSRDLENPRRGSLGSRVAAVASLPALLAWSFHMVAHRSLRVSSKTAWPLLSATMVVEAVEAVEAVAAVWQ